RISQPVLRRLLSLCLHDALPICPNGRAAPPGDDTPSVRSLTSERRTLTRVPTASIMRADGDTWRHDGGTPSDGATDRGRTSWRPDRKSTRLNSSHVKISYAVLSL